MSVSSVRAEMTRVVREAFENNNGEIDAEGMKAVIDEAKRFRLGSRELEAVLQPGACLLYTSPSPRDATLSRMPSSA